MRMDEVTFTLGSGLTGGTAVTVNAPGLEARVEVHLSDRVTLAQVKVAAIAQVKEAIDKLHQQMVQHYQPPSVQQP